MTAHEREYQRVTRKVRVMTPKGWQWANVGDVIYSDGQGNDYVMMGYESYIEYCPCGGDHGIGDHNASNVRPLGPDSTWPRTDAGAMEEDDIALRGVGSLQDREDVPRGPSLPVDAAGEFSAGSRRERR